jgi:2-oxoglutarate dehydrogenase E1 component
MTADFGVNQGLVEEQFLKWVDNPLAVDEAWRAYFESLAPTDWPQISSAGMIIAPVTATGMLSPSPLPSEPEPQPSDGNGSAVPSPEEFDRDGGVRDSVFLPPTTETTLAPVIPEERTSFPPSSEVLAANELQARLTALINAYRVRGHLFANLDPLGLYRAPPKDEFVLKRYGLAHVDPETIFATGNFAGPATEPLRSVLARLKDTYARTIGVEFTFLENQEARDWLRERMELTGNHIDLSREQQIRILTKLTDAEIFEQFLHTKYTGAKRFSLEGGESVIPMLDILGSCTRSTPGQSGSRSKAERA